MSEGPTIHATSVAIDGRAVLLRGRPGAGKSDLALRLIDRGAALISDDYTLLIRAGARLLARAPSTIAGMIEVRGVGILQTDVVEDVAVALLADLDADVERMPEETPVESVEGVDIPVVPLRALEASAPIKLEMALKRFGLPHP